MCRQYFIPFYGQILFHCMAMPHFIYSLHIWWTFWLLWIICYAYSRTSFMWTYVFIYLAWTASSGIAGAWELCITFRGAGRLFQSGCTVSSFFLNAWCIVYCLSIVWTARRRYKVIPSFFFADRWRSELTIIVIMLQYKLRISVTLTNEYLSLALRSMSQL